MKTVQKMVEEFHKAFNLPHETSGVCHPIDPATILLRLELISEEYAELVKAFGAQDPVDIADALADLAYVVYGTAIVMGMRLDKIIELVHEANMAKLGADGKPILREDGRVIKPEGWVGPEKAIELEIFSCEHGDDCRERDDRVRDIQGRLNSLLGEIQGESL